jgi:predicted metalloprotease with PDZ domain
MSRMAPFTDGGRTVDRTNWSTTVISYYSYGGAIALALDLTLRERTDNRVSLDDFMRAMWRGYGKSAAVREGYVDRPYTAGDAEATLAEVAGDASFARDFFARYIHGHDVADYATLLAPAGFSVRKRNPGRGWLGDLRFETQNGLRVSTLVAPTWPIYQAGIDEGDTLQEIDGRRVAAETDVATVLQRHKPGDTVAIAFTDRSGVAKTARVTLTDDPHIEVVSNDAALTPAQKQFRDRWLGAKKN